MLATPSHGTIVRFATLSLAATLGACSAAADDPPGASGGSTSNAGAAGTSAGGTSGGANTAGASTAGSTTGGGGSATAGSGSGGADSGGTASGGSGGNAGSGAASGAAGGSNDDCTPNPAGTFVVTDEVVFDEKTCLSWTKTTTAGHPYAEADTYCMGLSLGGYDDWRLPTAGEVVSIFKCDGMYPPTFDVFTVTGDGIWTTTLSGTIAGDEPKVCGAGQASGQYYDFGKVGGQNTRCVRGPITLPDRTDCKTNNQICSN